MICEKCEQEFQRRQVIDGILRDLGKRKQCLDCSPFGVKNTKPVIKTTPQKLDPIIRPQTPNPTTPQIKLDPNGNPRHLFSIDEPKYRCGYNRDHCESCGYEYDKSEFRKGTRKCGDCFWAISSAKIAAALPRMRAPWLSNSTIS